MSFVAEGVHLPVFDQPGHEYDILEIDVLINEFKVFLNAYYLMEVPQGHCQDLFVVSLRFLCLHKAPIIIL